MTEPFPRKIIRTTKELKKTFEQLRQKCLDSGTLFEDQHFITDISTLQEHVSGPVEWKRPSEIVKDPQMFVKGATRFDVNQGKIGDCWLLSAMANLTSNQDLLEMVVPKDQSFTEKYAGIFHFRFWQYGRWVEVVIDDRLPTQKNKLCMTSCKSQPNEFWASLLEKAYAKCVSGSYAVLKGGNFSEAMSDFTGGLCEFVQLQNPSKKLYDYLLKASEKNSFIGCTTPPAPSKMRWHTPQGILYGHVYSITAVRKFRLLDSKTVNLLRLRNPWGYKEWTGHWSDSSKKWNKVCAEEKKAAVREKDDGEFWISYEDFLKNFQSAELCHLRQAPEMEKGSNKNWESQYFEGAWVIGATAGGSHFYPKTFKNNPRYMITLNEADENDDDGKCTMVIGLMQKDRRSLDVMRVTPPMSIGFYIYELKNPENEPDPLDFDYVQENTIVAPAVFINRREVSARHELPPGSYCIIPSTHKPNEEGEFILRVCTEKNICCIQNDQDLRLDIMNTEPTLEELEDEKKLVNIFRSTAGKYEEIDWEDLANILDSAAFNILNLDFPFAGFHKECCRTMLTMLDLDMSGKMGIYEFKELWGDIRFWTKVFKEYDTGRTGRIAPYVIREALKSAGFSVGTGILNALMMRYGDKEGRIIFDDFMMCAVKLKTLMAMYHPSEIDKETKQMALQDWMKSTIFM